MAACQDLADLYRVMRKYDLALPLYNKVSFWCTLFCLLPSAVSSVAAMSDVCCNVSHPCIQAESVCLDISHVAYACVLQTVASLTKAYGLADTRTMRAVHNLAGA